MLRPARPEDADALAGVRRAAMRGAMPWLPELHTPDDDCSFLREIVLPEQEVWVAEADGVVAGFTALGTRAGVEFMEHLYVAPEYQRRGIGTALMESAKARRPAGFRLWVFQRNAGARDFYEHHGFRLVELTDGSGNEEKEPDALYEWSGASTESASADSVRA
ncbi:MAG: GNAT family N-acetyltransferase [Gaiellaceae bacterium]